MLFLGLIAIVLGILALWLAFWVVMFFVGCVSLFFETIALNKAEKHHPGIKEKFNAIRTISQERAAVEKAFKDARTAKERRLYNEAKEREFQFIMKHYGNIPTYLASGGKLL